MTVCAVKGCHNQSGKQNKTSKIGYHVFPSDPIVAARWTEQIRLNRKECCWKPSKNTRICSVHFDDSAKYITKTGMSRLRLDAVPTRGLHIFCTEEGESPNRKDVSKENSPDVLYSEELNASTEEANKNETIEKHIDIELDPIFDTPRIQKLRIKLNKKIQLQRKQSRKIRSLLQKVRRLKKKNMSLKAMLRNVQKNRNKDGIVGIDMHKFNDCGGKI